MPTTRGCARPLSSSRLPPVQRAQHPAGNHRITMAVKDNKGQAKVKAKGTHSKGGIVKSRKAAVGSWKEARKARKNSKQQQKAVSPVGTVSGAGLASSSGAAGSLGDGDLRVLLLGEGDFGFAAALAMDWGECPQLTATTLGSESATLALKGDVEDNVETVKAFGGTVCFKVDATALHASELVMARAGKRGYDRIVFNFPASELKTTSSPTSSRSQPKPTAWYARLSSPIVRSRVRPLASCTSPCAHPTRPSGSLSTFRGLLGCACARLLPSTRLGTKATRPQVAWMAL